MKYKCVIFDCDGVLVDSEKISNHVLIEMFASQGVKLDFNYATEHFSGTSLKEIFSFLEEQTRKELPEGFMEDYRKRTFELFKTNLKPINGVEDVLKKLKIPICVASSGPMKKILLNLATTGLVHYFNDNIFSSYEIKKWKPDPGIFIYAADNMGFKIQDCAVIEDSIAGVKAGIAGGFDVYAYSKPKNKNQLEKEGAKVFEEMGELLELLK